jgi:hypothetical protein
MGEMSVGAETAAGQTLSAARLGARVNAVLEPKQRIVAVAEALAAGSSADAAHLIAGLLERAGDATSGHRAALDATILVLGDDARLPYERRAAIYSAAIEAALPDVALLLFDAAPPAPGVDRLLHKLDDDRPLVPTGRPLTLGERKSLARGHRRELLLQLLRDPHPDVIAVLVDNPHLTEADVLKIASRRPVLAGALLAIFHSDRWRARAHVRRALVLNPCTPLPLAARLMATLPDRDLSDAAVDAALGDTLRGHAGALLRRRRAA